MIYVLMVIAMAVLMYALPLVLVLFAIFWVYSRFRLRGNAPRRSVRKDDAIEVEYQVHKEKGEDDRHV